MIKVALYVVILSLCAGMHFGYLFLEARVYSNFRDGEEYNEVLMKVPVNWSASCSIQPTMDGETVIKGF